MNKTGIYIHIPFCRGKCPYCDFYSLTGNDRELKKEYVKALLKETESRKNIFTDTIYLGGGTPSVLPGEDIAKIIEKAKESFNFTEGEITVECNPSSVDENMIKTLRYCGVNRISLGLQSFNENERKILGRRTSPEKIKEIISSFIQNGIDNISLDVMLGVPEQTVSSLKKTLEFCVNSGAKHISAYILKIEEGTFFAKHFERYNFPDDEETAKMYEFTRDFLEKAGFFQYEISNFSKEGYESRHNLKYWNCEEYLGLGASAHSFFEGRRFYHERDIRKYIEAPLVAVSDGEGGDFSEYAMLRLRLREGLLNEKVIEKYGFEIPRDIFEKAKKFIDTGYVEADEDGIRLTVRGFLISNYILSEIL